MCWDSSSSSIFQSTLSVRRATVRPCLIVVGDIISIHALRRESDKIKRLDRTAQKISIHALRKESDSDPQVRLNRWNISIHALRKESDLSEAKKGVHPSAISIHALRKESDQALLRYTHCA